MKFISYLFYTIITISIVWFLDFVTPENAFDFFGIGSYILRMIGLFTISNKIYNEIYSNNTKE